MRVYCLPFEPLDSRYTKQWYIWFKEVFESEGVDCIYIDGEMDEQYNEGSCFVDMRATFIWKFEQMKRLFKHKLKNGDIVFFMEGGFAGIEALEYLRKFNKIDVKIVSIWHSGSYDPWDMVSLAGMKRVCSKLEEAWLDMNNLIFVATEYHKNMILENRIVDEDKIKVTGLPLDVNGMREKYSYNGEREGIVFAGRLTIEKGIDVVRRVEKRGYKIFKTHEHKMSKNEFYDLLSKSKVIFAPSRQENFGYSVAEGMALDCIPVVPDGLSFVEYVPKKWRYSDEEDMYEKLNNAIASGKENMHVYVKKYQYQDVIKKMIRYMEELA